MTEGSDSAATASLWRNPEWLKLWLGQAISLVGDFVFTTTVVLWVGTVIAAGQPWAPAAVSGVLIAAAAPVLLVGPFAGVFVDRLDRRRIMLVTDLIRAGLIGLLMIIPLWGRGLSSAAQLACVYVLVALSNAASQFFNPARFAVIAAVLPEAQQAKAFGMSTATSSAASVLGPTLAAPLLFGIGVQWALAVNVASFLISYVAVLMLRLPPGSAQMRVEGQGTAFWPEFLAGLRFFLRTRLLVVIVVAVCIYQFGVGAINVLGQFFVEENLHVDAGWLGTLNSAVGVGSVVGAILTARVVQRFGEVNIFAYGIVATGLVLVVYSRLTSLPMAIVAMALTGIPVAAVNVVLGKLMLQATPKEMLGRVNSVMNPLVFLSSIVAMATTGLVASIAFRDLHFTVGGVQFGRIDTILLLAAALMATAGLVAAALLRRPSDAPADAQTLRPTEVASP